MSIPAKHWALSQKVPGGSSRRYVLLMLADWMIGNETEECWPTIETLAFETGLNRQTVMAATADLEKHGLITRRRVCKNLVWETHYKFVGYVPSEWIGSTRPSTYGNSNVQKTEGTKNRTYEESHQEGTKTHTVEGTKNRTYEGTVFRTRTGNRQGITGNKQGERAHTCENESEPPPPTDSDLEAMASSGSLFAEADVPAEEPPKKKPRPPTVPFPDSLPDEWRQRALKLRPNIDPEEVFTALRSRYGETTVRKAMSTWQREYFKWHGRQWPKKTFNRNQTQGRAYVPGDRKFSYATLDTSQFDYEG